MKKIIALLLVFLLVGCAKEKEVKDYYIYVTDSNLSTVYTLLNLVKTDDNKSFIWYTDTDLINTDYLNKPLSFGDITLFNETIQQLSILTFKNMQEYFNRKQ